MLTGTAATAEPGTGRAFAALGGIVAAIALVQAANGVIGLVVPLSLGLARYPASVVGLVVTAHAVGFLLGGYAGARVIRQVGFKPTFAFATVGFAVVVASLQLAVDPWLWVPLRFLTGIASALIFMVAESWIAVRAPKPVRGRVLGLYMTCNRISFALGQLLLAGASEVAPALFVVSAAAYALAAGPIALARAAPPEVPDKPRLGLLSLYRIAPASLIGAIGAGLVNTAVVGIAPLYGLQIGLETGSIALLTAALQVGGLALQWPLGWLADSARDRRLVIAGATGAMAVLSLAIGLAGAAPLPILCLLFSAWGGFALALYALCLSHAGDRAEPDEMLVVSSGVLLAWALGAIAGPTLATAVMERAGPSGLFHYAAATSTLVFLGCIARRLTREPVPGRGPG